MAERVLGNRYTVQDKIGTGGMAVVYRGLDNVLGRTVAIKNMLPQYATDPSFAARFKQEAQAAAALQSPYIVSVYDWGKDGDTYYIVMEYLRGTDLKSGIRKHGALDGRKVAQIGLQISQALSVAHKHDIIHRDIKPQNIMVQPDGNIKVMDFGIARAKNSHITTDNSVLGTAHYVSPEQTQGKELGPTSDIYSLGIVMYEAATGRVPFEGEDAISVALKQVQEQPVPPSQVNENVDPTLEAIILKCMQKDPADRFQTADELARTLRDYLAGRTAAVQVATRVVGVAPVVQTGQTQAATAVHPLPVGGTGGGQRPVVRPAPPQQTAIEEMEERERSGRMRTIGIALGVIVVLALIGFAVFNLLGGGQPETREVPNLIGMTQDQAVARIEQDDFFVVGDIKEEYSTADVGTVIDQRPGYQSMEQKGTRITIVVSKGEEPKADVTVPDLTGMTPDQAEARLEELGLEGKAGESVYSDEIEVGLVAQQSPKQGTTVKAGDTITYQLSKGVESVEVPDVVGRGETTSVSMLQEAGLNPVVVEYRYSNDYDLGVVMWQSVTGSQPKGTTVELIVSNGPEPEPEPTPEPEPQPSTEPDPYNEDAGSLDEETSEG